jgi:hypothetical protein
MKAKHPHFVLLHLSCNLFLPSFLSISCMQTSPHP